MERTTVRLTILVVLLVFVSSLFAADASNCQYYTLENKTRTVQNTYVNNVKVTETVVVNVLPLESVQKRSGIDSWATNVESFQVSNRMNVPIDVHISYFYDGQQKTKDVSLSPLGSTRVTEAPYDTIYGPPIKSNYKLSDNFDVSFTSRGGSIEKRQEQEVYQEKTCKQCPSDSGNICANDGEAAKLDFQCGSGVRNAEGLCIPPSAKSLTSDVSYVIGDLLNKLFLVFIGLIVLLVLFFALKNGRRGDTIIIDKRDGRQYHGEDDTFYDDRRPLDYTDNYGSTGRQQPPSRYPCNKCNTSGKYPVRCHKCNGKGTYFNHIRLYGREETCPICGGTGTTYETCRACGGEGYKI